MKLSSTPCIGAPSTPLVVGTEAQLAEAVLGAPLRFRGTMRGFRKT